MAAEARGPQRADCKSAVTGRGPKFTLLSNLITKLKIV